MANPGNNVTRFSLYGGMWHPYGSFAGKTAQDVDVTTGSARGRAHKPLRKITLPDGSIVFATSDQISTIRAEYEARTRQEGQAVVEERKRVKEKGRRRAKVRAVQALAEIQVPDEPPIPIPASYIPEPAVQALDLKEQLEKKLAEMEIEEENALLLLVMLS